MKGGVEKETQKNFEVERGVRSIYIHVCRIQYNWYFVPWALGVCRIRYNCVPSSQCCCAVMSL